MQLLQIGNVVHKERLEALHLPVTVNVHLQITIQVVGHSTATWSMLTGGLATKKKKDPKKKSIDHYNIFNDDEDKN